MSETIYQRFIEYFENRQYDPIPTDSSIVTMFGTYEANHLYLINLIELGDGYDLDLERYLEYKQLTMSQFAGNRADKTILLNVIITDRTEEISDVFNYTPDLTEDFIDVVWVIDKVTEKLVIPKKQLKNVLGLEKDLRRLLEGETTTYFDLDIRQMPAYATYGLIGVNVLLWLLMEFRGGSTNMEVLLAFGAMKFDLVMAGQYYRLMTAMFLHIGIVHLFYNMFSLYIFGYRLERFLPPVNYLLIYVVSGLVGSCASMVGAAVSGAYPVAAGASGAVYGLMGSLLYVTLIRRKPIDGITSYVIWLMFILGMVHSVMVPNVDLLAHLGGFIGGLAMTPLVFKSNKRED